jgi:hypothetical protein
MIKKITFFTLSIILLSFVSCKIQEDLDDLKGSYDPEVALPLFFSKFKMNDIIGEKNASALKVASDGKMTLFYKSAFTERKATDILKIFSGSVIPIGFQDSLAYLRALYSSELTIKKIDYKKGTVLSFGVQLITPTTEDINLRVWIPTLVDQSGKPFEATFNGKLSTTNFFPIALNRDLFGYTLTPLPVTSDSIQLRYSAITAITKMPVKVNVFGSMANPAFNYLEGFMPKKDIKIDQGSVDVSIYNQIVKGDLKFEDPKISVLVENSYGYPMRTKVNLIKAISKRGDTISLTASNLINDGFDFPYPTLKEVGQTKKLQFDFTNANSNIKELLNSGPNTILYSIDAVANPLSVKDNGFMTDSTTLRIGLEVEIPIFGSAKNFEGRDTISDIDLSALDDTKQVELKLASDNQLPAAINLEVIFLDETGKVLDNLTDTAFKLIDAAQVDANGNVIKAAKSETLIPMSAEKILKVRSAKKLILITTFATSQDGNVPVRILSTQEVSLRAGLKIVPKF